jgi:hypothetical protein
MIALIAASGTTTKIHFSAIIGMATPLVVCISACVPRSNAFHAIKVHCGVLLCFCGFHRDFPFLADAFFSAALRVAEAMATACRTGRPARTSVLIFFSNAFLEADFMRGIEISLLVI